METISFAMELQQLRYFIAVAEAGSFSGAVEPCGVTQPALSQQIARLEAELRHPLLERLGRRVRLTDAGRVLFDRAQAILAAVDDTQRRLREADGLSGCRLAIGAIPTIAPYFLPRALDRFLSRYSEVELTVHEDVTRNLIAATLAGELDLAV